MATIRKREGKNGTSYCAIIRKQGFRQRTATFPTKKAAQDWAKKTEGELTSLKYDPTLVCGNKTLSDVIKAHSGAIPSKGRLAHWNDAIGSVKLKDLHKRTIKDHLDHLASTVSKRTGKLPTPATINRYKTELSSVLSYAVEQDWLDRNPCRDIKNRKENNTLERWISMDEIPALRTACKAQHWDRLWLLVSVALCTGARLGELLNLRWGQVDFQNGAIYLTRETKTKKPRTLTIIGEAFDLLQEFNTKDKGSAVPINFSKLPVFPGRNPLQPRGRIHEMWKQARVECGIWNPENPNEHVRFHTIRHSTASLLLNNGERLATVKEVLGHTTIATTQRYAHLEQDKAKAAVQELFG